MRKDKIPSIEQCYKLMAEHMLPNIYEHSVQVMNVADTLVNNLKNGFLLNKKLIAAASLLHDITKTKSLQTREPHDQSGALFMRELGFDRVAEIVEEHVILKQFDPEAPVNEKEIVYYSDKRVMHEKIVSVNERMDDIIERYGKTPEMVDLIKKNTALILRVEDKINLYSIKDIVTLF